MYPRFEYNCDPAGQGFLPTFFAVRITNVVNIKTTMILSMKTINMRQTSWLLHESYTLWNLLDYHGLSMMQMVLKCIEASTSWISGMFDQLGTGTGILAKAQSCGITCAKPWDLNLEFPFIFNKNPEDIINMFNIPIFKPCSWDLKIYLQYTPL